ncbi:MAG: OmpP1/FadL family transporter [Hyphomicrobiaceae bacterium]
MPASRNGLLASVAAVAVSAFAADTMAGGFAIREQSAQFQGTSFAGSAAGGGLSSMYWNPAAAGQVVGPGIVSESHFSAIFGQAENTVETYTGGPASPVFPLGTLDAPTASAIFGVPASSEGIASPAIVGASYYAYKLSPSLTAALSINSGFGLTTKPTSPRYLGSELGQTTKLLTMNAAPTLAYQVMPGVTIGVGAQIQYAKAKLALATGAPIGPLSIYKDGEDIAFGATAGVLIEPAPGTSIGLGWRSQLTHDLEGDFSVAGTPFQRNASAELNLPDIVTFSFRQSLAQNMRVLGTIEWTNWSRFKNLEITGIVSPIPVHIDANWSDSWYFALGGEYDMSPGMTLRAGIGYELSPVDDPTKRFTSIPDADRVWLSAGASVQLTETMSADLSYTHIFVENGEFDRTSLAGNRITGTSEAQVDIISASLKTRWGGHAPLEPMK